ncbi:Dnaj homolog subfamily b member 12 [Phtheirospermum japonicum]|uniref:Dnaj homolog subfamily b member 12 n=1 Tax=Phtheirospermum japonicum TaxID=374723 RepID=A0A830DEF1_9LAMI|nr:Dnaj homolog subfamily b member 12 [Phtheirospermum japonicum]
MECNKDEAIRAKQIAEKKMETNDFDGARKFALIAQNLCPELENITHLLSICNVHCSAQKKIFAAEKDWYSILQVEKMADELTVRKQYRRLALFLHPDKNRFPGAESAFKLICEANAILSDPTKKTVYDSKIRAATVRSAPVNPPPHMTHTYQYNKQYGAQPNVSNGFSSLNQSQTAQPSFPVRQEMFWTSCAFCSVKYQYSRNLKNTMLKCQHCMKSFMGYEITTQSVPTGGPKWVPPNAHTVPVKPGVPNPGKFSTGVKNDYVGSSVSREASQWCASRKAARAEAGVSKSTQVESAPKMGLDRKGKKVNDFNVKSSCNGDVENKESISEKNGGRKRGRKRVVESSSESSDTSSDSELEDVKDSNSGPSNVHFVRRSSRKRQNVIYAEGHEDDDDAGNQNGTADPEESARAENVDLDEKVKGDDAIVIESDSEENPDKDICDCEDPEFNDFDKVREEGCFSVNQFWACYDEADGMPRFYAKVKKVCASPFELIITWLEADPIDEAHAKWIEEELPVGCGGFKLGDTITTSSRLTFSHQMHCEKGKKRGSLIVYPRKGQVWAIFKDWDMNWISDGDRKYKYEVVEILSNFDAVDGVKVCYLDKVNGFVSIFQRSGTNSFLVGLNELYKFSHSIYCYKMTGSERDGVPVGSFELDPASLPLNPDDLYYPGKIKTGTKKTGP